MANTRIKGRHVHLYAIIDGKTQVGSFTKVESWSHKPDAKIDKTEFIGQAFAEGDVEMSGHDFSFTVHEEDTEAMDYWDNLASKYEAGQQLPDVAIVVITNYLNPAVPAKTETFQECVLKHDERNASSKKDYVKNMFTGFAPKKV